MYRKITRGLLLDDTTAARYSQAVQLGGDTCAMFEAWMLSTSGSVSTVTVSLEASADGQGWDDTPSSADSAINTTLTSAPAYSVSANTAMNPAFTQVRLRFDLAGSSTPKSMVEAAIRTFVRE